LLGIFVFICNLLMWRPWRW